MSGHRGHETGTGRRTRREVVRDVIALGSGDRRQLLELLKLELVAAGVYERAGAAVKLSSAARRLIRHIHVQERAHAEALARLLPPATADRTQRSLDTLELEAALARRGIHITFASLRSERDWFAALEDLESALEGAYFNSLGHITAAAPATLAARILASEAQHLTLLFRLRHPQDIALAVAEGLVEGTAAQR